MADREETIVAPSEPELRATLRALRRSIQPVGRMRRAPTGDWYVHVRAAPRTAVAPPPPTYIAPRPPRALFAVAGVGAVAGVAAGIVLVVLATAWAVRHWALLLGAVVVVVVLAGLVKSVPGGGR